MIQEFMDKVSFKGVLLLDYKKDKTQIYKVQEFDKIVAEQIGLLNKEKAEMYTEQYKSLLNDYKSTKSDLKSYIKEKK